MITKNSILQVLKNVCEPETNQNILRHKMLRDIKITNNHVDINFIYRSEHYSFSNTLENRVKTALDTIPEIKSSKISFSHKKAQPLKNPIKLPNIKEIVVVSSGKGGVGKSTASVYFAKALQKAGLKVGLLDADAYGPNIPNILNCFERPIQTDNKIKPVEHQGLKFLSLGSMIPSGQAVVWRGPMLHKMLRQFFQDVLWGKLDYLIIDMPPGTGDVQLSIVQSVQLSGAVIVTTPQELSITDVRKGISMFKEVHVDLLGIIENMSYFLCECGAKKPLFGQEGGVALAQELNIPLLGQLPLNPIFGNGDNSKALEYYEPIAKNLHQKLNLDFLN